jgi:hypothetical protein
MVQIFERPYFEVAYAKKLFEPFQRLHSSSDYSGTSIGLTTVKRIIWCHGLHVEGVNTVTEDCAKNLIAITQEIMDGWNRWQTTCLLTLMVSSLLLVRRPSVANPLVGSLG